jgi:hypothetical protein
MSTSSNKHTAGTVTVVIGYAIVIGAVLLPVAGVELGTGKLFGISAGLLTTTAGYLMRRNASQCSEEKPEVTLNEPTCLAVKCAITTRCTGWCRWAPRIDHSVSFAHCEAWREHRRSARPLCGITMKL